MRKAGRNLGLAVSRDAAAGQPSIDQVSIDEHGSLWLSFSEAALPRFHTVGYRIHARAVATFVCVDASRKPLAAPRRTVIEPVQSLLLRRTDGAGSVRGTVVLRFSPGSAVIECPERTFPGTARLRYEGITLRRGGTSAAVPAVERAFIALP
jgi:hypothetical protein